MGVKPSSIPPPAAPGEGPFFHESGAPSLRNKTGMGYNQPASKESSEDNRTAPAMNQQRYEKEIEEILKQAGEQPQSSQPHPSPAPGGPPGRGPRRKRLPSRRFSLRQAGISYKLVLLAGVVLLFLTLFWGQLFVFFIGLALLIAGYIMYYRAPRGGSSGGAGPSGPKMWRGRPIDPDDG